MIAHDSEWTDCQVGPSRPRSKTLFLLFRSNCLTVIKCGPTEESKILTPLPCDQVCRLGWFRVESADALPVRLQTPQQPRPQMIRLLFPRVAAERNCTSTCIALRSRDSRVPAESSRRFQFCLFGCACVEAKQAGGSQGTHGVSSHCFISCKAK